MVIESTLTSDENVPNNDPFNTSIVYRDLDTDSRYKMESGSFGFSSGNVAHCASFPKIKFTASANINVLNTNDRIPCTSVSRLIDRSVIDTSAV